MSVEAGQGADAGKVAAIPRRNLGDLARLWINSIRTTYFRRDKDAARKRILTRYTSDCEVCLFEVESSSATDGVDACEIAVMGNLQSDGKKKGKRGGDEQPQQPARVTFEKVHTPAKRQAPPPPKPTALTKVWINLDNSIGTLGEWVKQDYPNSLYNC